MDDERMDFGWIGIRTGGWMDGWVDGWMDGWMDWCKVGWMDDGWVGVSTSGWMNYQLARQTEKGMNK